MGRSDETSGERRLAEADGVDDGPACDLWRCTALRHLMTERAVWFGCVWSQVDVKTGALRGASMLGHPLFCCGMFFCIPFPGMYASCITSRHQRDRL